MKIYLLYAEEIDGSERELWTFSTRARAEDWLRGWAVDFLGTASSVPPDNELVNAFIDGGTLPRFFECEVDGDCNEFVPFVHEPETTA